MWWVMYLEKEKGAFVATQKGKSAFVAHEC